MTCPDKKAFLKSHDAIIDYFSIIPFIIELALFNNYKQKIVIYILRILRMARFLRLLSLMDDHTELVIFFKAVKKSKYAIFFLLFFILCIGTFYAACVYYAELTICTLENDVWIYTDPRLGSLVGTPSPIQNILDAMWWSIVTMATVGYGDIVPKSTLGKVIASWAIFTAVIFMNLPMAILSANLTELYLERRLESRAKKRAKQLQKERLIKDGAGAISDDDNMSIASVKSYNPDQPLSMAKTRSLLRYVETARSAQQDLEENIIVMKKTMELIIGQHAHLTSITDRMSRAIQFSDSSLDHRHHYTMPAVVDDKTSASYVQNVQSIKWDTSITAKDSSTPTK